MRNLVLARQPSTGLVTAGDGITRRHVASEADLADLHYTAHRLGITLLDAGDIENLDGVMGADIAAVLAGLADDEAAIIAAVREIVAADADTEVQISDEQLDRLADRVVAAVPPHVAEAVRAAFARAGQAGA